jgi:hypothetical protein
MALSSRDQFEIRAFIIFGCLSHRSNGFWRQALAVAASQTKRFIRTDSESVTPEIFVFLASIRELT